MNPEKKKFDELDATAATMLMTLAARSASSELAAEVGFSDPDAKQLMSRLPLDLSYFCEDSRYVKCIALRAQFMDRIALNFFLNHPHALGVELGCGLCTRGRRISRSLGGKHIDWYSLDMPSVIEVRKAYLNWPEDQLIASSVTDLTWLKTIDWQGDRPLLLLMEGVAQHLTFEQNHKLFSELGDRLSCSPAPTEMVLDYAHPSIVGNNHWFKKVGNTPVKFRSGFQTPESITQLHPSLEVISTYPLFPDISLRHAQFNLEFQAVTGGELPYNIAHLRFENRI